MILTFTGDNNYEIAQATRQLIDDFAKKHGINAAQQVDAQNLTRQDLPDLLQGITLFATNRLVVLKNLSSNKTILEFLPASLEQKSDSITVVIADSGLDKRTKFYKFLKNNSNFKEFGLLNDAQLAKWVIKKVEENGGKISSQDANYLLQLCVHDQWLLHNEIVKLCSFNPEISQQTINMLVDGTAEASVFDLLDAAMAGNLDSALQKLAIIKNNEDPYKLFGLIASQAHTIALIGAAGAKSADEIAKVSSLHPFVVRKNQAVAKKMSSQKISSIAADVATCDMQLKSTGLDPWLLIRLCLQKIAQ